ncbi:4-diphosphocytidyl-2-C-methyl-D-erythritol kinase [Sphingomonas paucimobilis]|nr:4-diphosphocytidyl-2-C-methyl-D-erythritol kinase [Sphingomonas paucimobilis]
MTVIVEPAPAKINLALHVRRRRDDGYHELETLFAFCRDGDVVTVERAGATSLTLTGPFAKILAGEVQDDNLVMRAARGFVARFGVEGDHAITLDKHLPVASGIGGGSADAAATLRALAKLHGVAVDHPELFALAGELGPMCRPACSAASHWDRGRAMRCSRWPRSAIGRYCWSTPASAYRRRRSSPAGTAWIAGAWAKAMSGRWRRRGATISSRPRVRSPRRSTRFWRFSPKRRGRVVAHVGIGSDLFRGLRICRGARCGGPGRHDARLVGLPTFLS